MRAESREEGIQVNAGMGRLTVASQWIMSIQATVYSQTVVGGWWRGHGASGLAPHILGLAQVLEVGMPSFEKDRQASPKRPAGPGVYNIYRSLKFPDIQAD